MKDITCIDKLYYNNEVEEFGDIPQNCLFPWEIKETNQTRNDTLSDSEFVLCYLSDMECAEENQLIPLIGNRILIEN